MELQALCSQKKYLPYLSAWLEKRRLEKRRPEIPHNWQRRWVMVRGSHILWSDKQRAIEDAEDPEQRKYIMHIMHINGRARRSFVRSICSLSKPCEYRHTEMHGWKMLQLVSDSHESDSQSKTSTKVMTCTAWHSLTIHLKLRPRPVATESFRNSQEIRFTLLFFNRAFRCGMSVQLIET